jgi:hypothetical protein
VWIEGHFRRLGAGSEKAIGRVLRWAPDKRLRRFPG